MKNYIKKYPFVSLSTLSLLCGFLWRLEVELYGWEGLIWLSYFHQAILLGFLLFMWWTNALVQLSQKKQIYFNLAVFMYGIMMYIALKISLTYLFAMGPFALLLYTQTPSWLLHLFYYAVFFLIPLIPAGTYWILKIFGQKVSLIYLFFAMAGMFFSIPLSVWVLELVQHKGGADYIHAIKSGVLVPFWMFSIGLVIIGISKNTHKNDLPLFT